MGVSRIRVGRFAGYTSAQGFIDGRRTVSISLRLTVKFLGINGLGSGILKAGIAGVFLMVYEVSKRKAVETSRRVAEKGSQLYSVPYHRSFDGRFSESSFATKTMRNLSGVK